MTVNDRVVGLGAWGMGSEGNDQGVLEVTGGGVGLGWGGEGRG